MSNKKKSVGCFFLLLVVVLILAYIVLHHNEKKLSYENFDKTCNYLSTKLNETYDLVKLSPTAIVYDGNQDNLWTEDTFTIMDNNAATPKQNQLLISGDNYITKVILSYTPYITDNHYIMVDRLGEMELNSLVNFDKELFYPIWSMNSFTVNGIYTRVETFGISESKEMEDDLILYNGTLTNNVQQLLLEFQ